MEQEQEIAYEWTAEPIIINNLQALSSWKRASSSYELTDSIYDTDKGTLAKEKVGVRVRTKGNATTLTAKKYIGEGMSGESKFEEYHTSLTSHIHPLHIHTSRIKLHLPKVEIAKQLEFYNQRTEVSFRQGKSHVLIVNEHVTYSDTQRVHSEHLLEVEFSNVTDDKITEINRELESKYPIRRFKEGKSDRAKRFLAERRKELLIENLNTITPIKMSAHGGKGIMDMRFFHQAFNHFYSPDVNEKVIGFENSNWDFFGYMQLPLGADIKEHLHDETDEIYFIIKGSATIRIDDSERAIRPGDCILTRKGSSHSVFDVTEPLEFIAIEIR